MVQFHLVLNLVLLCTTLFSEVCSLRETLFKGASSGPYTNDHFIWYNVGGYQQNGKRRAYDTLQLSSLALRLEDEEFVANYTMRPNFVNRTMQDIADGCIPANDRISGNTNNAHWEGGWCIIADLVSIQSGTYHGVEIAQSLRLGVGDGTSHDRNDWVFMMPSTGNGDADYAGSDAFDLGGEANTNDYQTGQIELVGEGCCEIADSVLFSGATTNVKYDNNWDGWYNPGTTEYNDGDDGKTPLYDTLPLTYIEVNIQGDYARYVITSEYSGMTMQSIASQCISQNAVSTGNTGSDVWNNGHCIIGFLTENTFSPRAANQLRLGVGDGSYDPSDWAFMMLEDGNAAGDFDGSFALDLGGEWAASNYYHDGNVVLSGWSDPVPTQAPTNSPPTPAPTLFPPPPLGEITLMACTATSGTDRYTNRAESWYEEADAFDSNSYVTSGPGKYIGYDTVPLRGLRFEDSRGATAYYDLNLEYQGMTLLEIVRSCQSRNDHYFGNRGASDWTQGQCTIGIRNYGILRNFPYELRLGAGNYQPQNGGNPNTDDWALFQLQALPDEGSTMASNQSYNLGGMGSCNDAFSPGEELVLTGTKADSVANQFTRLFAVNYDQEGYENSSPLYYQPGTVHNMLGSSFVKYSAYDNVRLDSLMYLAAGIMYYRCKLKPEFRGKSMVDIADECFPNNAWETDVSTWTGSERCLLCASSSTLVNNDFDDTGPPFRLGVTDGQNDNFDWAFLAISSNPIPETDWYHGQTASLGVEERPTADPYRSSVELLGLEDQGEMLYLQTSTQPPSASSTFWCSDDNIVQDGLSDGTRGAYYTKTIRSLRFDYTADPISAPKYAVYNVDSNFKDMTMMDMVTECYKLKYGPNSSPECPLINQFLDCKIGTLVERVNMPEAGKSLVVLPACDDDGRCVTGSSAIFSHVDDGIYYGSAYESGIGVTPQSGASLSTPLKAYIVGYSGVWKPPTSYNSDVEGDDAPTDEVGISVGLIGALLSLALFSSWYYKNKLPSGLEAIPKLGREPEYEPLWFADQPTNPMSKFTV